MIIERFNDKYIQPYIMVNPENRAMKIVRHHEEIQVYRINIDSSKSHGANNRHPKKGI
jgi:hypothetical protein